MKMELVPLQTLGVGERGMVCSIEAPLDEVERLAELAIVPGHDVDVFVPGLACIVRREWVWTSGRVPRHPDNGPELVNVGECRGFAKIELTRVKIMVQRKDCPRNQPEPEYAEAEMAGPGLRS